MRMLIVLLLLWAPAWAQPWLKAKLLVVPGKSLGPLVIGQPIPPSAYKLLGPGFGSEQLSQISSPDGGGVEWASGETYLRVKCHDGKKPEHVYQIFWTAPNPRTATGLGVGSSLAQVQKRFPKGRWTSDSLDGLPTYLTPGLNFSFDGPKKKVVLMHLFPTPATHPTADLWLR